jgi:hypothetical protein
MAPQMILVAINWMAAWALTFLRHSPVTVGHPVHICTVLIGRGQLVPSLLSFSQRGRMVPVSDASCLRALIFNAC